MAEWANMAHFVDQRKPNWIIILAIYWSMASTTSLGGRLATEIATSSINGLIILTGMGKAKTGEIDFSWLRQIAAAGSPAVAQPVFR